MSSIVRVVIGDEWKSVYVGDVLALEGHRLRAYDVLETVLGMIAPGASVFREDDEADDEN